MSETRNFSAEIASVGTELLLGQIIDTHAPRMAQILAGCGITCLRRVTIGDNFDRICSTFRESLSRADILVTIGGLGPTADDLTRDAIATVLNDELILETEYEAQLRDFFQSRGMNFAESNLRQAYRPASAKMIENPNGTAPGLLCEKNNKIVLALPGPSGEFNPMADGFVRPYLERLQDNAVIHSRTLRVVGVGESEVERRVIEVMTNQNPTVAPYAHTGEVHLRITAKAANIDEANALIDPIDAKIRSILGNAVFGTDNISLEEATIELLLRQQKTVSVAESMTGGGLAARLTNVPGSSQCFLGGVIGYTISAKCTLLGIDPSEIDRHGPVSRETAVLLATHVCRKLNTDFGIGIVGNAGPTSDRDNKPVGQVFVAVVLRDGHVVVEDAQYRGIRDDIRRRTTQLALNMLRRQLL